MNIRSLIQREFAHTDDHMPVSSGQVTAILMLISLFFVCLFSMTSLRIRHQRAMESTQNSQ